jgi:hypothetical protein
MRSLERKEYISHQGDEREFWPMLLEKKSLAGGEGGSGAKYDLGNASRFLFCLWNWLPEECASRFEVSPKAEGLGKWPRILTKQCFGPHYRKPFFILKPPSRRGMNLEILRKYSGDAYNLGIFGNWCIELWCAITPPPHYYMIKETLIQIA